MQLEILPAKPLRNRSYPANTIIVEWLDDRGEVKAVAAAIHEYEFQTYDNDREYSHFLEQVSWLENDVLSELKAVYPKLYKDIKTSGRLVITDEKSHIVFYQN